MREINECTAEVFRRSEKRIKERKRNINRILALCIPLFLMVSVWSAMTIPAMLSANDKTVSAEENAGIVGGVDECIFTFVRIEQIEQIEVEDVVTTASYSISEYDANKAAQIYNMMKSAFLYVGADDGSGENYISEGSVKPDESENKDFSHIEDDAASGYKVTFTSEDGAKTVFIITKDTLIDESNGRKAALTEERRTEILTALGLTVTQEEPK